MHDITREDLAWIDDAVGYGNVASIGAAYRRLLGFRNMIDAGCALKVALDDGLPEFNTTHGFDYWVRTRFPIFADDVLHPVFNR